MLEEAGGRPGVAGRRRRGRGAAARRRSSRTAQKRGQEIVDAGREAHPAGDRPGAGRAAAGRWRTWRSWRRSVSSATRWIGRPTGAWSTSSSHSRGTSSVKGRDRASLRAGGLRDRLSSRERGSLARRTCAPDRRIFWQPPAGVRPRRAEHSRLDRKEPIVRDLLAAKVQPDALGTGAAAWSSAAWSDSRPPSAQYERLYNEYLIRPWPR